MLAAIYLIRFLHAALLMFAVIGWAAPWRWLLVAHAVYLPLMVLQWRFNNGTCFLTNLEQALLRLSLGDHQKPPETKPAQQGLFVKRILGLCFRPLPSDAAIKKIIYATVIFSWSLSALRLIS